MSVYESLTTNEKILMNVFWKQNRQLTSAELVQMCKEREWSQEYILSMIKNIRRKGMLDEVGIKRAHARGAKMFKPSITKEEYIAELAISTGIGLDSFAKTTLALAKGLGHKEEIIEKLEYMLKGLEEQEDD